MLYWMHFSSSFKCRQPRFCNFFRFKATSNQSWWWSRSKKSSFTALWEITVSPFFHRFEQNSCFSGSILSALPNAANRVFVTFFRLEAISNQSWWWSRSKKSSFTVLWEITVSPFFNQFGRNSCYSESIFTALSSAANRVFSCGHSTL